MCESLLLQIWKTSDDEQTLPVVVIRMRLHDLSRVSVWLNKHRLEEADSCMKLWNKLNGRGFVLRRPFDIEEACFEEDVGDEIAKLLNQARHG